MSRPASDAASTHRLSEEMQSADSMTVPVPLFWNCECGSGSFYWLEGWLCASCDKPWPPGEEYA